MLFYLGILLKIMDLFRRPKENPKKILIIKLSAMGDTVLLEPVVRGIRAKYKKAWIQAISTDINKSIWENMEEIDEVFNLKISGLANPIYLLKLLIELKNSSFDIVFNFDQWLRISGLLTAFSFARIRIGFKSRGQYNSFTFNKKVLLDDKIHEIENFARLAEKAGVEIGSLKPEFKVSAKYSKKLKNKLLEQNINLEINYMVIPPGCGKNGWQRAWPEDYYQQLIEFILLNSSLKIILTGGSDEKDILDTITGYFKENPRIITVDENLSIYEVAELLRGAKLLVSGNTGIMHLAAAVSTICIALHGPTNSLRWGPIGSGHLVIKSSLDCSPCLNLGFEYGCNTRDCMDSIKPEDVSEKLKGYI